MPKIHEDRDVVIPTIHLNGTSAERLTEDLMAAYNACRTFQTVMRDVTPDMRDYYTQGPEAGQKALDQHAKRQDLLEAMRLDLEAIIIGIRDQVDERDARRRKAGY